MSCLVKKKHLVKYVVVLFVCFPLKQKDVFEKKMFSFSNPKPNPDVVQHVVADVGGISTW